MKCNKRFSTVAAVALLATCLVGPGAAQQVADPGFTFIECIATIYPVNGHATPVSPGAVIQYEVPGNRKSEDIFTFK